MLFIFLFYYRAAAVGETGFRLRQGFPAPAARKKGVFILIFRKLKLRKCWNFDIHPEFYSDRSMFYLRFSRCTTYGLLKWLMDPLPF